MKTDDYVKIELYAGASIDTAVAKLLKYREAGKKAYVDFNGRILYSDTVTMDSAYTEITGSTRDDFYAAREAERKAYEQKEKEHQENIPNLSKEWIEKGHKILDKKYWDLWDKCVPIRLGDLYHGMELGATLEIVEKLNAGCSFLEATDIINKQGHSGMSYGLVCSMVKVFCDRGEAFLRTCK